MKKINPDSVWGIIFTTFFAPIGVLVHWCFLVLMIPYMIVNSMLGRD